MTEIHTRTTQRAFESLYEVANASGKFVGVTRKELLDLLMDYSIMVGKLIDAGYWVTDGRGPSLPPRVRRRPKEGFTYHEQ